MGVTVNPMISGKSQETRRANKTITFDGAANTGAVGAVPIFTVTGEVLIEQIVPYCTVDLVGAGSLALGVTGSTALFLAATVGTAIDVGEFLVNTTPVANGVAVPAAFMNIAITDNIIGTVSVGTITAGAVRFDVLWRPLSPDGNIA